MKNDNKKNRRKYQRDYHENHREEAAERKAEERNRRERCRSYWYAKLILKRDMSMLIKDVSPTMLEQERVKYLSLLDEPCEVIHSPPEVVRK